MGIPPPSLHSSLDLTGTCDHSPSGLPLSIKALKFQSMKRRQQRKLKFMKKCTVMGWKKRSKILMKRRAIQEGSRRHVNGFERRVRALQGLVPDGDYMAMDGLFRRAADYIMCLEMKVRAMQIMVELLSDSSK